jgi:chromosome condensin MukBEF MukE localization factor
MLRSLLFQLPTFLASASQLSIERQLGIERFQALDTLVLMGVDADVCVTRADVERLLAPDGFAALRDRGRWPQVLARALQRKAAAPTEGAA